MTRAPEVSGQHYLQQPRHRIHQNVHWQKNEVYTPDYYSAIKENEMKILAAAWMDWEIFKPSEESQRETDKHPKISHTGEIYKFIPMN